MGQALGYFIALGRRGALDCVHLAAQSQRHRGAGISGFQGLPKLAPRMGQASGAHRSLLVQPDSRRTHDERFLPKAFIHELCEVQMD